MPKQGKEPANKNAAVKRLMMEGKLKDVLPEGGDVNQKDAPVNEATEGSVNDGEAEEREKPKGELNDADYTSAGEGGDEEENEEDGEESEEQVETEDHVRYFFEDDDKDGDRVGCAFDDLCVRAEGRYALCARGPDFEHGGRHRVRRGVPRSL